MNERTMKTPDGWNIVKGTSFADPADVRAFRNAKARGLTDQEAFKFGDNGIGCWGDDTTEPKPMVALPPEDWQQFGKAARGKKVEVKHGARTITAELRDTMPHKRNIKNGAGIDLNPAACIALGIAIPAHAEVAWRWAQDQAASGQSGTPGGITFAQLAGVLLDAIKSLFQVKK